MLLYLPDCCLMGKLHKLRQHWSGPGNSDLFVPWPQPTAEVSVAFILILQFFIQNTKSTCCKLETLYLKACSSPVQDFLVNSPEDLKKFNSWQYDVGFWFGTYRVFPSSYCLYCFTSLSQWQIFPFQSLPIRTQSWFICILWVLYINSSLFILVLFTKFCFFYCFCEEILGQTRSHIFSYFLIYFLLSRCLLQLYICSWSISSYLLKAV